VTATIGLSGALHLHGVSAILGIEVRHVQLTEDAATSSIILRSRVPIKARLRGSVIDAFRLNTGRSLEIVAPYPRSAPVKSQTKLAMIRAGVI
jgi:hypothetical protein